MQYFYITYLDRAEQSGRYPHDINLGCLDDYDIAEKYMQDELLAPYKRLYVELESQENIFYELRDEYERFPLLITNDVRFYLRYKRVLTYSEFKLFCGVYDKYDSLGQEEKLLVSRGKGTVEALEHLEKLIKGEGKFAYEYQSYETWHDESGSSRQMEVDSGWKIQDKYWVNENIKKQYGL